MQRLPPAICAAMSRATSSCRSCCLLLLAWLQSTISAARQLGRLELAGRPPRRWRRRSSAPCRRAGSRGSPCCRRVSTIATWPFLCTDRKWCGRAAAWIASIAILMLPSVPFLKPIGADRPEASSRCTWLSVVRAPIAPQVIRSPMYCGEITSRNSLPAGSPSAVDLEQQLARDAQALVDAEAVVEVRVVDQALPADRGARLLEVDPHHDLERVGVALALRPSGARAYSSAAAGSWIEHGPMTTSSRSSLPLHDAARMRAACPPTAFSTGVPRDREEADQVLRRRQRRDVVDALVVGLAGAVDRVLGVPAVGCWAGLAFIAT